ncbi:MAG: hypothetical protein R2750_09865 [Bacteroidales bacterium]
MRQLLYFILLSVILSSCYAEWKMAKGYIESKPEIAIMILPANYVFKKNQKIDNQKELQNFSELEKDSVLMAKSSFLKEVSDSIFLERFINSMYTEFEKLGFTVYTENYLDSFLFVQTPAYIFNIAQIELEELYTVYEDQQDFGDLTYYKNFDLNAINYNFWFELSELNDEKENTKLFFISETINDQVYGYFTENIFTGDVKYKYNITEIDMDVIYKYCTIYGRRHAGYTFDYIMNKYITENWPPNKRIPYYMHYNRENSTLDMTWEEKFISIEE